MISGLTILRVIEYIIVGKVCKVPEVKYVITKSSIDKVNDNIAPVTMPDDICGRITLKKALTGVQPRSRAASYRLGLICRNFGNTEKITYGKQNVVCANTRVQSPGARNPVLLNMKTNNNIKETQVTISGLNIGILVIIVSIFRERDFIQ